MYAYPRTDLDDLLIFSINARARVYTCAVLRPPWLHQRKYQADMVDPHILLVNVRILVHTRAVLRLPSLTPKKKSS
jgi:hypothetical protein